MTYKKYIFYSIITISLILTILIAIHYKMPMGEDISFHLKIAKGYYLGKWMMTDENVLETTKIPYPPILHLILMFGFIFKTPITFTLFIQLFLYPLALYTTGMLVYKELGFKHAIIVLLLLISSYGFFDRTVQIQPQSFDMIFFPISIYFFLRKNTLGFVLSNFIMVYTHSYYSLFLFGTFVLFFLFRTKGLKMILISFLTFLPLIILTLSYMGYTLEYMASNSQNIQEEIIRTDPVFLIGYFGGALIFVFIIMIYHKKINLKDDFQLLLICWIVCLLPLVFAMDRLVTYLVVPVSILASIVVFKIENKYSR